MQSELEVEKPPSRWKLTVFGVVFAVGIVALVITGIQSRATGAKKLQEWTDAQAIPSVAVQAPGTRKLTPYLDLPGRLEAFTRAPILARVNGYVKSWTADIGANVKAGQLLAEIEAPDLDQQLLQARADLLNAQSAARLSEATLTRRRALADQKIVSAQDLDERMADLASKQANVKAQTANVDRLEALASFKRVVAPFDGIVTSRETDIGALINSGTGVPMFVVSDVKRLRAFVSVPQAFVPLIRRGAKTLITVPEYAERTFDATVETSTQAVDSATGTTRMQLIVDNGEGLLMPGSFANIRIDLSLERQPLHVPASALIMGRAGVRVAIVDGDNKIRFKPIVIARDLGQDIEVATGINIDDRVVTTPPDGLNEGDEVRIAGADKKVPAAQLPTTTSTR
ncbi:multidrug resistance protein MdtA precursor [Variibacter gotjawalensis]|uniref:Multidrug resistance protein MdtA n=1 Tax=Variibacter gotjawalensis TaxID=1333996 RepID=A0A0S3PSD2_9BRAD|nr:efflux RND transporter periplasmic adaptor subunit [Variibacter gotjawalensis]NIK49113.1 RND family efflux transporter MFP subunit [Variibacter gotjawalensis]RZS50969.1 RND family efflux transporter MFP subunit [Variibacter gotjawalensis]BAT58803.1 multidrug resistance protein MdtA precursor [Variibacter gotjawalensis]